MLGLTTPSLKYGDFSGSSFRGMTLFVTVEGADFTNADLTHVVFAVPNPLDVNFTGANLTGADFSNRDLTGSTFTGANITGVNWGSSWGAATCPDGTLARDHSDTCVGHLTPAP
jgi:uncharacterized protein YjbI with pentapeptide repeats